MVVFSVPVQSVLSAVIGSEFFGKTITVSLLPHSLRLSSFRLIGSFSLLRSEIPLTLRVLSSTSLVSLEIEANATSLVPSLSILWAVALTST